MERLRTLNSYQIFKIQNKKCKTYSGGCPFQGLSNDTTLMQIQSGRTVPLIWERIASKIRERVCGEEILQLYCRQLSFESSFEIFSSTTAFQYCKL